MAKPLRLTTLKKPSDDDEIKCLLPLRDRLRLGYNVTTDNFFTSCDLARRLQAKRISIVGTIRRNMKELPPLPPPLPLHGSAFHENGSMTVVHYMAKPKKPVDLLSTLHRGSKCEGEKKKNGVYRIL
jgi:hypothetical protein